MISIKAGGWRELWPVAAAAAAVVLIFLVFPPYYGFMDDSTYVFWVGRLLHDFAGSYATWLPRDFAASGRLRPLLPLMVAFLYGPTQGSPLALHIWNALWVVGILGFLSVALARLWTRLYPGDARCRPEVTASIFVLCLLYPWTHIGVVLPAMQEKLIFLFAAWTLWVFTSDSVSSWRAPARLGYRIALIVAGCFTREQFVLFFPLFLAAGWTERPAGPRRKEAALYFVVMLAMLVIIFLLGRHSEYKSKYGLANAAVTIARSRSVWIFLALAGASCLRLFFERGRSLVDRLPIFCLPLSLIGFVLLMLPWGLGGYLNFAAAPLFAVVLLTLLRGFILVDARVRAVLFAISFACFAAEVTVDAVVKNEIGLLLGSPELRAVAGQPRVYAPCDEGKESINQYARKLFGYDLKADVPPGPPPKGETSYWIVGKHLSCWPGDFDPEALVTGGKAKVLWQGRTRFSTRLLEVDPGAI